MSVLLHGKGISQHHKSGDRQEGLIPTVAIDYAFMGQGEEEDDSIENPLIVLKDSKGKL